MDVFAGLDPRQRAAVGAAGGAPLAILAPAGSGKTRVLTRRIAHLVEQGAINPRHTLAVTFTRKAAGELVDRLTALRVDQVTAGTFHALCLAQLRRRQAERGRELPGLLERKARILAPLVGGRGDGQTAAINEVASEIEWAKARGITPEQFVLHAHAADRQLPRPPAELADLYARYEADKRRRRLIDFDDLLWWCAEALETDADFAATTRFRHRHFFVDEFQDVSPAQLRVLRGWLGARSDICVVGDEAQSIYGFAGAESSVLVNFTRHFPGGTTMRLGTNYRSTPQIVAAASAVLGTSAGVVRPVPHATRESGATPTVRDHDDDRSEARAVARAARDAHDRGVAWCDIAVLYRTNAQSAPFEQAFGALGVPFRLPGVGGFMQRPEVKAALTQLRAVERAAPGRPLADHLADLVGDEAATSTSDAADGDGGAAATDAGANPVDAATGAAIDAGPALPAGERRTHLDALVRLGYEYLGAEGGSGSLAGFVAWLTTATRGDDIADTTNAVEFLSFHRAKGLEWRVVFVTGIEQGLVPISYARTPEAKAEEQRLLHVAVSRAVDELHLSWARERHIAGRARPRKPSPWLAPVERVARGEPPVPPGDPRAGVSAARAALRATRPELPEVDRALFEALRAWRTNEARAAGVPAFVVFGDATLRELAQVRPTTRTGLLDISGIGPTKLERYGEALLAIIE
jgi:DNA helicase-2/ATP-dependent DNA helicase PcrA